MNRFKISEAGLALIRRHEGLRLTAYRCPAGVLTIGYGHTGNDVKPGMRITQAEADRLLVSDTATVAKQLEGAIPDAIKLTQNQVDAFISFVYNVGIGNFKRSTMLRLIIVNPNSADIRKEFMRWVYANKTRLDGLVKRRMDEANLYFAHMAISD